MKSWFKIAAGLVLAALLGAVMMVGAPAGASMKTGFQNCTELRAVHPEGVPLGHEAYRPKFDRDRDGWACEPAGWDPEPGASQSSSPAPEQTKSRAPRTTSPAPQDPETLPVTGPGGPLLAGGAVALLAAGGVLLWAVRRRRVSFKA